MAKHQDLLTHTFQKYNSTHRKTQKVTLRHAAKGHFPEDPGYPDISGLT